MRSTVSRLCVTVLPATALALAMITAGHAAPVVKPVAAAATPADIARGKALFTGTCGAYCHRPSTAGAAEANSDAPSLFDCEWRHGGSDKEIFQTISHGVEGTRMVAFGGAIPDDDIRRIIAYLHAASQCKPSR